MREISCDGKRGYDRGFTLGSDFSIIRSAHGSTSNGTSVHLRHLTSRVTIPAHLDGRSSEGLSFSVGRGDCRTPSGMLRCSRDASWDAPFPETRMSSRICRSA